MNPLPSYLELETRLSQNFGYADLDFGGHSSLENLNQALRQPAGFNVGQEPDLRDIIIAELEKP